MGTEGGSGLHPAAVPREQAPALLSISAFAAICRRTCQQDGTPDDRTSDADLAALGRHGDAGGVVSIEMTGEMKAAGKRGAVLFADCACTKARAELSVWLAFVPFMPIDLRAEYDARVSATDASSRRNDKTWHGSRPFSRSMGSKCETE